jgi:putative endonuclease
VRRDTTTVLGRGAEDRALALLESHGLTLLARNHRCRGGEIDLVMRDGATLVLVEVRSRSSTAYGGAAASVGARKQRRCIAAARHLLRTRPELARMPARFDVVAIDSGAEPGSTTLNWIRDAFRAG